MIGAALALALALAPVTVTTQNVRAGMPSAHARHDIGQAADGAGVVFAQEMTHRHARAYRPRGWGSAQSVSHAGLRADCATFYDRALWRRVSWRVVHYEHGRFRLGNRYALVTVLRSRARPSVTLATVNVHSVTHSTRPGRRLVFAGGMARVRAVGAALAARWGRVVVAGDFNRPWPLRARFGGFASLRPPRPTGPYGGRPDYVYAHGLRPTSARVVGHTFSDHEGVRVRLG